MASVILSVFENNYSCLFIQIAFEIMWLLLRNENCYRNIEFFRERNKVCWKSTASLEIALVIEVFHFRKLKISILQSIFLFRKLQISIFQIMSIFPFRKLQIFISFRFVLQITISQSKR